MRQTAAHRPVFLMPAPSRRGRTHEQRSTEREGKESGSHPVQNRRAHVNIWNSLGGGVSTSLFTSPSLVWKQVKSFSLKMQNENLYYNRHLCAHSYPHTTIPIVNRVILSRPLSSTHSFSSADPPKTLESEVLMTSQAHTTGSACANVDIQGRTSLGIILMMCVCVCLRKTECLISTVCRQSQSCSITVHEAVVWSEMCLERRRQSSVNRQPWAIALAPLYFTSVKTAEAWVRGEQKWDRI